MKTSLKLSSVIPNGVTTDNSGSSAIELIYSFLLQKFKQDKYSYIFINQTGKDLNEVIFTEGRGININYRTDTNIKNKNEQEKNIIRLNFIHNALCRIANNYQKLNIKVLEEIKELILKQNFSFEFVFKSFPYKKTDIIAELSVVPTVANFKYFSSVKCGDLLKCKLLIYNSLPEAPIDSILNIGKWKNENEIVFWGKDKEVEIIVESNKCEVKYANLTKYRNPPIFEMFRFDTSEENRDLAHKDWHDSLPADSVAKRHF